ncbi:MAG: MATE family efflux transporter [Planctomycetaceae bacterium]
MTRRRTDALAGDVRTTVFVLALPVLMEQFLSFLVGMVDTWLSGRTDAMGDAGTAATSAVGFASYVGWLASMLFSFVGTGTTALVARHWGGRDFETANRVANRSLALAVIAGAAVYVLVYFAAPLFATLLGLTGETQGIVVRYLRWDAIGYLFTGVSLIAAAALRGAGDMRTPMAVLGLVSVLNAVLSAALVFGVGPVPAIGLNGIVAGTVIARIAGAALMLGVFARGRSGLKLDRREWVPRGEIVRRILRVGIPAGIDGGLMWIGHFVFLTVIGRLAAGEEQAAIFAAHFAGVRVEAITYLPAVAYGYAAATMIGQSLGARDSARAFRAGREAVWQCSLLALVISIVFFAGAEGIYRLMHDDPAVWAVGVPAFRLLAFFQVPLVMSIIFVHALRGAGDTRFPMLVTLLSVFGVRLPVAYLAGVVLGGGLFGAWIGMCADVAARALLVAIRYLRGRWIGTEV